MWLVSALIGCSATSVPHEHAKILSSSFFSSSLEQFFYYSNQSQSSFFFFFCCWCLLNMQCMEIYSSYINFCLGWGILKITTNHKFLDQDQMFAAGFLEGIQWREYNSSLTFLFFLCLRSSDSDSHREQFPKPQSALLPLETCSRYRCQVLSGLQRKSLPYQQHERDIYRSLSL